MSVVKASTCDSRRGRTTGALARTGAPTTPSGDEDHVPGVLWSGETFGSDLDLEQETGRIAQPEAVALEAARRIDEFDAARLGAFLQIGQIVRIAAEREMVERLALSLPHHAPALVVAECLEAERAAGLLNIQSEIGIEPLRRGKVRHREHEMIE